jgi:hypothetical protein
MKNANDPECIKVVPSSGGAPIDFFCCGSDEPQNSIGTDVFWGPPGKGILFTKRFFSRSEGGLKERGELWHIPSIAPGVSLRKMELEMPVLTGLSFHPDGKTITFTSGQLPQSKIWVIENFIE